MLSKLKGKAKKHEDVDLSFVENADDRRILGLLAAQGDPLAPPRHTRFYFMPQKDAADKAPDAFAALAEDALELGFRVGEQRSDLLVLEIDQSMHVDVVNAARKLMEGWAAAFGVEFDGWECQVKRSLKAPAR